MTAKHHRGTTTFIAVRATSVLLLPFVVWFIWGLAAHAGGDADSMRAWLAEPVTALLFAFFLALSAWHMAMGMGEVIEDYIHSGWRGVFMTINWLAALAVAGLAILAAYMLAF